MQRVISNDDNYTYGISTSTTEKIEKYKRYTRETRFEQHFTRALNEGNQQFLSLHLYGNSLARDLEQFFRTAPLIETVEFLFENTRNERRIDFDEQLISAASQARIKQASFYFACPPALIRAFTANHNIERISVLYNFDLVDWEHIDGFKTAILTLLNNCDNAPLSLRLDIDEPLGPHPEEPYFGDYEDIWPIIAEELRKTNLTVTLSFTARDIQTHLFYTNFATIFYTTNCVLLLNKQIILIDRQRTINTIPEDT